MEKRTGNRKDGVLELKVDKTLHYRSLNNDTRSIVQKGKQTCWVDPNRPWDKPRGGLYIEDTWGEWKLRGGKDHHSAHGEKRLVAPPMETRKELRSFKGKARNRFTSSTIGDNRLWVGHTALSGRSKAVPPNLIGPNQDD